MATKLMEKLTRFVDKRFPANEHRMQLQLELEAILCAFIGIIAGIAGVALKTQVGLYVASFSLGASCIVIAILNAFLGRKGIHKATMVLIFAMFALLLGYFLCCFLFYTSPLFLALLLCLELVFLIFSPFYIGVSYLVLGLTISIVFLYTPLSKWMETPIDANDRSLFLVVFVTAAIIGLALCATIAYLFDSLSTSSARYKKIAYLDSLTGVHNQSYLIRYIDHLETRLQPGDKLGVMFIDIDNFKSVNDIYGHLVGNEVLITVANTLRSGRHDLLVRWGGDEFLIIKVNPGSREELIEDATALKNAVAETKIAKADDFKITISIGISYIEVGDRINFDDIIRQADSQLSKSKDSGKNRISID